MDGGLTAAMQEALQSLRDDDALGDIQSLGRDFTEGDVVSGPRLTLSETSNRLVRTTAITNHRTVGHEIRLYANSPESLASNRNILNDIFDGWSEDEKLLSERMTDGAVMLELNIIGTVESHLQTRVWRVTYLLESLISLPR